VGYVPSTYLQAYTNPYLESKRGTSLPTDLAGSPLLPTPRRQSIKNIPAQSRDLQPYRRATEKRRQRTIKQKKPSVCSANHLTACSISANHLTACSISANHLTACSISANHLTVCIISANHLTVCSTGNHIVFDSPLLLSNQQVPYYILSNHHTPYSMFSGR